LRLHNENVCALFLVNVKNVASVCR